MINYAIYAESGQVLSSGTTTEEVLEAGLVQVPQGCNLAVTDIPIMPGLHRHDRGSFLTIPPPPGAHCEFDYASAQWYDPRTPETEWPLVQAERNRLLQYTDWTQLPDVPVATKEAWATYRQTLRDITEQPDPFNIVWPTPPVT